MSSCCGGLLERLPAEIKGSELGAFVGHSRRLRRSFEVPGERFRVIIVPEGEIWQRIKNIGLVTGLGGHFATKVCNRRGCSATNLSATSPLKTAVLYTEVRDKGL